MGKATVNWDSQETWQRVVAAIIASGVKIDQKQVALYFGTTYDTIENRFRKIKKEAQVLKEEVESGERGEIAPARKSAPSTPRKPRATPKKDALSTVTNGRISKSSTPKSRHSIKEEGMQNSFATTLSGMTDDIFPNFTEDGNYEFGDDGNF